MLVYTIGYGGRQRDEVLTLLHTHGVRSLVDIRLRPDRASMGIWVKAKSADKGIAAWLSDAGIDYYSFVELGNVFREFDDWQERYTQLMAAAGHVLTQRLRLVPQPFCLHCAEKRVAECHRRQVADYLATHWGAEIHHLE